MCDCIDKVNEQLKPDGLYLETISMLNFASGKARETTFCNTQRMVRGKGKRKKSFRRSALSAATVSNQQRRKRAPMMHCTVLGIADGFRTICPQVHHVASAAHSGNHNLAVFAIVFALGALFL